MVATTDVPRRHEKWTTPATIEVEYEVPPLWPDPKIDPGRVSSR